MSKIKVIDANLDSTELEIILNKLAKEDWEIVGVNPRHIFLGRRPTIGLDYSIVEERKVDNARSIS